MEDLIKSLKYHSKERKILRRKILKKIREHRYLFIRSPLVRKIDGRWLGDLSDTKIIDYCEDYFLGEER